MFLTVGCFFLFDKVSKSDYANLIHRIKMPGANCSIPLCGVSRRNKEIGIFKAPDPKNPNNVEWRKRFISAVLKARKDDADLKRQIVEDSIHVCSRHFHVSEWTTRESLLFI